MKSVNASSVQGVGIVDLDLDQRGFSGNIESLQMTATSIIDSHPYLNRIDETRGNITVEGSDLLVNERSFDWQTHIHHSYCFHNLFLRLHWHLSDDFDRVFVDG